MAAGPKKLIAAVVVLVACAASLEDARGFRLQAQGKSSRIISLVPALTEMLFAIGAGSQVVGVSSFDQFPPEVSRLPRLGALLDPDIERILSLRPTLVAIYGSQTELQEQFARAGIGTYVYRHGGIETIYRSMRELGDATGHRPQADRVVRDLQARVEAVRTRVRGREKPKVLLVIGRQPGTLREIYVSGGVGFLHEMLDIAGGRNVFADVTRESAQPSQEAILARAPDLVVEVHAEGMFKTSSVDKERAVWAPLSSLPAVRNNRVHVLLGQYLVVPGPRFAEAAETLARTIHPGATAPAEATAVRE
jgi:iron complex transport system substrate-binding protein